ncbi:riboflavin synthase [Acuticoccus sp.]|uniref:riboflavin synthase n=1 Tax=Acuticoccus sp. TaxID=1904378 RepID=UPI003B52C678
MFTGIITDVGRLVSRASFGDGARLAIASRYAPETIAMGASIACAGCCLTVTTVKPERDGSVFTVDASAETLARTTLGTWREGERVNLERALRAGDELGGHLVAGHVDGRAEVLDRIDGEDMTTFRVAAPADLARYIAHKGSVTLDGTSLTSNEAADAFTVAMIPHTLKVTTWSERQVGDMVNIEVDTIARYVARLVGAEGADGPSRRA